MEKSPAELRRQLLALERDFMVAGKWKNLLDEAERYDQVSPATLVRGAMYHVLQKFDANPYDKFNMDEMFVMVQTAINTLGKSPEPSLTV